MNKDERLNSGWVTETLNDQFKVSFKISETLFQEQSKYQEVRVVNSSGFGRILLLDGMVMVSDRDEFIYHEMISHVPLFIHPDPKSVLIIGGGDGGTAREVCRHSQVSHCIMVEIDPLVIEVSKKYFPQTALGFSHSKVQLKIEDGIKFVQETQEKFDIILVDGSDPVGPAEGLFNFQFYQQINNILKPDGIIVTQSESPFYQLKVQNDLAKIFSEIFPLNFLYTFSNLTYPGSLWTFLLASKKYDPIKDFQTKKFKNFHGEFKYYNPMIHQASFCLPEFLKKHHE